MRRIIAVVSLAVLAAGYASPADAAERSRRAFTISDARIAESSGLAVSSNRPKLAYTLNDSGNTAAVYALNRRTGDVVGVTTLTGYSLSDTEAIGVGTDGTMWVADIGDNSAVRHDIAIYSLPEPGRGDSTVTPERFPLRYPHGRPEDAEAILVGPKSRSLQIVTKGLLNGRVFQLPRRLRSAKQNRMRPIRRADVPGLVTDGSYSPDGSQIVLRTYDDAVAYDPKTWDELWERSLPSQRQGESLTVDPDGTSFLIGTEGSPSPVYRVGLPPAAKDDPAEQPQNESASDTNATDGAEVNHDQAQLAIGMKVLAGLGIALAVLIGWVGITSLRSRRRGL